MGNAMRRRCAVAVLVWLGTLTAADADGFRVEEVASLATTAVGELKPHTIYLADHRKDELADPISGLTRFEDWAHARPVQKQFLSLYPGYDEPTLAADKKRKLHVYVVEARFLLAKPPASIDLARHATLDYVQRVDPALKQRLIGAADVAAKNTPDDRFARRPDRNWCEGAGVICTEARYKFEGQLPSGIALANKLRDQGKKAIPDFLEFQNEIRPLAPEQLSGLTQLTGFDGPVDGALEQSTFWVNQVIQFGRFLAVLQSDPRRADVTVATIYLVLAIRTDVLSKQKEYEKVPILRNLVPAQVLMGNSSFNVGNSISAGLPKYARNRIVALAEMIEHE
jgi:hypothetical protein